jgi:hypothetical protein
LTVNISSGVANDSVGNGNDAATQFSIEYDSTAPEITSVNSSTSDGVYNADNTVSISVAFDESVDVIFGESTISTENDPATHHRSDIAQSFTATQNGTFASIGVVPNQQKWFRHFNRLRWRWI